jgi:hypothetical protein
MIKEMRNDVAQYLQASDLDLEGDHNGRAILSWRCKARQLHRCQDGARAVAASGLPFLLAI